MLRQFSQVSFKQNNHILNIISMAKHICTYVYIYTIKIEHITIQQKSLKRTFFYNYIYAKIHLHIFFHFEIRRFNENFKFVRQHH